jgi:hypothetical protein
VIDLVRQLIDFLSQEPLNVDDVVARVGPIIDDPGIPMRIDLKPALPGVRVAQLSRFPDSGLPYLLAIEPEPGAAPTPAELERVLGPPRRARTHRGMPPELIFYPPAVAPHWKIAVLAQVESPDDLKNAPVTSIAFRRDPVTTR